jgi:hypothetical protein
MGERLADVGVVREDLIVGVYPNVPVGRTALVIACPTLCISISARGKGVAPLLVG